MKTNTRGTRIISLKHLQINIEIIQTKLQQIDIWPPTLFRESGMEKMLLWFTMLFRLKFEKFRKLMMLSTLTDHVNSFSEGALVLYNLEVGRETR